jgi:quinol monooxygenase YgiN
MTIRKTARFTVDPDHIEEAKAAISVFVAHTRTEPGTIRYESWQSADKPSEFLHLMEFVDAEGEQAHRSSEQVKGFTDSLYPLCVDPPRFDDWHHIT